MIALDHDVRAAATFDANFRRLQPDHPSIVLTGADADLSRINLERPLADVSPDIVIGGPPCQGFSRIGRAKLESLSGGNAAEDPRNALYFRFLAAVRAWQPKAVVMENVPGMLAVKGRNVALDVAEDMAGCGYRVGYVLLNAVWFGVPQFRERLFFIGIRDDLDVVPAAPRTTHRAVLPSGYLRPNRSSTLPLSFVRHFELPVAMEGARVAATTAEDALADLPRLQEHIAPGYRPVKGEFRRALSYAAAPLSAFARLMRHWPELAAGSQVIDHAIRHTPRDIPLFEKMLPGDRYPEALVIARQRLMAELKAMGVNAPPAGSSEYAEQERRFVPPYPEDSFLDKWRKLLPGEPSWTVPAHLAKDTYSHIHYDAEQARTISIREAARLQSFPDGFSFRGNMGDCYRQIGNAVPPLLAWAIGAELLRALGYPHRPPGTMVEGASEA